MSESGAEGAVLVTGAAGFIGSAVVRRLVQAGRRVIGTDIAQPHRSEATTFAVADSRDVLRHTALLTGTAIDGIIHCGGISGPMLAVDNPADLLDINVRSTVQLLELTRVLGLRRFIGCSSVSAYGDLGSDAPVDEDTPLHASTVYGTSKAMADLAIQTYAARFGRSAAALRIGWVYGPGRRTDAILQPMVRSGLGGAPFRLDQGRDQLLQFVHVDDIAAALVAAFDAPHLSRAAYNVNGAEMLSVAAIADRVRSLLPEARIEIGPGSLADTDRQGPMVLDAARADFDWSPRIGLSDGLSGYIDWLRQHAF